MPAQLIAAYVAHRYARNTLGKLCTSKLETNNLRQVEERYHASMLGIRGGYFCGFGTIDFTLTHIQKYLLKRIRALKKLAIETDEGLERLASELDKIRTELGWLKDHDLESLFEENRTYFNKLKNI